MCQLQKPLFYMQPLSKKADKKYMSYCSVKLIIITFVVERVRSLMGVKDFSLLGAEY